MDLRKIIDKKNEAAQFMIDEITHICTKFEKRGPGSKGEQQACEYMAEQLKELGCETTYVDEFKENPGSFFGWIYITFTLVLSAVALFFICPVISIPLIVAGFLLAIFQFGMYKKIVDWVFPQKTGHNVTAIKSCKGEVKRRILFNGHPDACWEWPVNYRLGGVFFEGHIVVATLGAFYYLVLSIIYIVNNL